MKLDVEVFRYLNKNDFSVLHYIEQESKKQSVVRLKTIQDSCKVNNVQNIIMHLSKLRLISYVKGSYGEVGYVLGYGACDYLGMNYFLNNKYINSVGNIIGVGKESDIYRVSNKDGKILIVKIHRLGRQSFRNVKKTRTYVNPHEHLPWVKLSKISAKKEYNVMVILEKAQFPIPKPIAYNRHMIVMEYIEGTPLYKVNDLEDPEKLCNEIFGTIVSLLEYGLVHCDFNEFNIILKPDNSHIIIDFPQVISAKHPNAKSYFNHDVECLLRFFAKKYNHSPLSYPKFEDIPIRYSVDQKLDKTGMSPGLLRELDRYWAEKETLDMEKKEETY